MYKNTFYSKKQQQIFMGLKSLNLVQWLLWSGEEGWIRKGYIIFYIMFYLSKNRFGESLAKC